MFIFRTTWSKDGWLMLDLPGIDGEDSPLPLIKRKKWLCRLIRSQK
jgi:hypothetical protein